MFAHAIHWIITICDKYLVAVPAHSQRMDDIRTVSYTHLDGASTYFNTTPGFTYTKNCKYPLADVIYPLFVQGREEQGEDRLPYYVEACNIITEEALSLIHI